MVAAWFTRFFPGGRGFGAKGGGEDKSYLAYLMFVTLPGASDVETLRFEPGDCGRRSRDGQPGQSRVPVGQESR